MAPSDVADGGRARVRLQADSRPCGRRAAQPVDLTSFVRRQLDGAGQHEVEEPQERQLLDDDLSRSTATTMSDAPSTPRRSSDSATTRRAASADRALSAWARAP